jgi:hypothetical protein
MMIDNIERNRLPIRWRKTISIKDYLQLLFFDQESLIEAVPIEKEKIGNETNTSTEQKPLIVPPTRPKKKKKNSLEKTTKKTTRKSKIKIILFRLYL